MSDQNLATDLIRKRSRSSSPSATTITAAGAEGAADSPAASKKANTDPTGPLNLDTVDESIPLATTTQEGGSNETSVKMQTDEVKLEESTGNQVKVGGGGEGEITPMNIDADLPVNPTSTAAAEAAAAAELAATVIQMRALIVTQDASIIIGKAGKNVNEIREKSGSKINITEAVPGSPERVMVISGQLDAVSKAFGLVVRRINDEPFDVPSVPGSRAVTIRFIIPNARMGSVIGKAGSKIKEIQEASGARLQASEAMLPGSTERVLSVSGVADAIHIAVYYIGTILQEHSLANSQAQGGGSNSGGNQSNYRNNNNNNNNNGGNQSYQPGSGNGGDYGGRRDNNNNNNNDRSRNSSYGGNNGGGGGGGERVERAPAPGSTTQQIFIPNDLVGSIIGKGGSKINEIRQASQCQIKICDPGEGSPGANPSERLVTISGQQSGIQIAVGLLYSRLEQEKQKQLSG